MQNKKNRLNIERAIAESLKKQSEQRREFRLFGRLFYLHKPFITALDVQAVIDDIESTIPQHLFDEVDQIMIGDFEFLQDKAREAEFKDGAIYITNQIGSEKDLAENIIHELSHSIEIKYGHLIYGDMSLRSEFLGKRRRLKSILDSNGWETSEEEFNETEYSEEFDSFLYEEIGYIDLGAYISGLFVSPYAVTSLAEYWAVGFEDYFIGDREYVRKISPQLFSKIEGVLFYDV
jgi:hypothetical protein